MENGKTKDRPILFSGAMVRAIMEARKTQTRRVVKPQPVSLKGQRTPWCSMEDLLRKSPYGKPGDRLWVRESLIERDGGPWEYAADKQVVTVDPEFETEMIMWAHHKDGKHCASIHMPRWASRIMLKITDVRVERLQKISEADAREEGIQPYVPCEGDGGAKEGRAWFRMNFQDLWDSINGKTAPWETNPWVWVVSFTKTK